MVPMDVEQTARTPACGGLETIILQLLTGSVLFVNSTRLFTMLVMFSVETCTLMMKKSVMQSKMNL